MKDTRVDYDGEGLTHAALEGRSPYAVARAWVDAAVSRQAERGDLAEPLTLSVATVDAHLLPDVRPVLMRFFDERGPGFVSSTTATKAQQIAAHPGIAASLVWVPLFRVIRFRGRAIPVEAAAMADYWESRPWGSRISALASQQSQPIASRALLEEAFEASAVRHPDRGERGDVPVPDDWAGWRIECSSVEFWAGRSNRLHDRFLFERTGDGSLADVGAWSLTRLQP